MIEVNNRHFFLSHHSLLLVTRRPGTGRDCPCPHKALCMPRGKTPDDDNDNHDDYDDHEDDNDHTSILSIPDSKLRPCLLTREQPARLSSHSEL